MTCEYEETQIDSGMIDEAIGMDMAFEIDAMPLVDAQTCFGTGLSTICLVSLPSTPLSIGAVTTVDTDTSSQCAYTGADAGKFCVVAATSITIDDSLVAVGSRPLVLLATTGSIKVTGQIGVASTRVGQVRGAGGNASACVAGGAASNGRGGPGGSFGGEGGDGGLGEEGGTRPAAAAGLGTSTTLRGGCRGGNGQGSGTGGNGGGAVYLIAAMQIDVSGVINASGAAGSRSATNEAGGGGAGSGGMIALEAPVVSNTGAIFANGAGGGAGNDESTNAQEPASPSVAAAGGDDTSDSGHGGDGSAGATLTGASGGDGSDGGGGGGGGAGVIRVFPPQALGGAVSPAPT